VCVGVVFVWVECLYVWVGGYIFITSQYSAELELMDDNDEYFKF
jgi:hypothetical protein